MTLIRKIAPPLLGIAAAYYVTLLNPRPPGITDVDAHQLALTPLEVVQQFEKMAFDDYQPKEAVLKYFSENIIDHDPKVHGDRASIIEYLHSLNWSNPENRPKREIKFMMAQDDRVMVHHHIVRTPGTPGIAAVDIFRVKDGQIVEHWDVLQEIPQETENPEPGF